MNRIYLDHNAATPVHPDVIKAMLPYFTKEYGNASSPHSLGRRAREAVEAAREEVADLIGQVEPVDIVFTGGGTESDNFALKGAAYGLREKGRHIITSRIEHRAVLNTCEFLAESGYEVAYIPVDECGFVDVDVLKKSVRPDTILVSVMLANNEVGTIEPLKEIAEITREKGILLHTDAVQALGKTPIDVEDMGVDLLSASAHKIYGPKGIGALYINKKSKIAPFMHGGHHERNRRAGTENVPGIVGFGKACRLAGAHIESEAKRLLALRQRLWDGIAKNIRDVKRNGHQEKCLPNTLNVSFAGVEGESVLFNLDLKGIAASSGSACTSGAAGASHVLEAMGAKPHEARSAVRFSLGMENTAQDIDVVIKELSLIVNRMRSIK